MQEIVVNLHIHSTYSDGSGTYRDIAEAASKTGVDVIIITDHNIHVRGLERYYQNEDRKILALTGEEVHDTGLIPSRNHLLVLGSQREYSTFAANPQQLIDEINQDRGISFIAHPFDRALPFTGENKIPWVNWHIEGFNGIEIWNVMSEFKSNIRSIVQALLYAYFPSLAIHDADRKALSLWDTYLNRGEKLTAIGGSDAHSRSYSLGPLHATLFPYQFHFQTVNTHILAPGPLSGNIENDRQMIMNALRKGNAFVANDLPHPARGFNFIAHTKEEEAIMGDDIVLKDKIVFDIQIPHRKCRCRLMKDGQEFSTWSGYGNHQIETHLPGVYRMECSLFYRGLWRGWIYSNPIYIRKEPSD